eukprot:Gregarina_sp_Poly_1__978@NODE_1239_length_4674_cov_201_846538_g844_i0_p3_GENE_NODE_1239_length_4674_cov_201_846538_g844_i0NODE_1239_length_4674_cov_201_846538_g844_i0_p3_ORF_typecomplete_len129_score3_34DUF3273/PF11677_8/3_3e31_NODE_1239_length_4674_cov_201_846538_g844_i040714457
MYSIKYARGYRAGTKMLSQATLFDIVSSAMMTLFFFAQFSYLEDQWQTDAIHPNPMVIYGITNRLLHAVALFFYGGAFLCLEAYHSQGTAECWGWIILCVFKAAGVLGELELSHFIVSCRRRMLRCSV